MPDIKEAIIVDFQEFRLNNFNICFNRYFEAPFTDWTSAFCMLYQQNLNLWKYNLVKPWFFPLFFRFWSSIQTMKPISVYTGIGNWRAMFTERWKRTFAEGTKAAILSIEDHLRLCKYLSFFMLMQKSSLVFCPSYLVTVKKMFNVISHSFSCFIQWNELVR